MQAMSPKNLSALVEIKVWAPDAHVLITLHETQIHTYGTITAVGGISAIHSTHISMAGGNYKKADTFNQEYHTVQRSQSFPIVCAHLISARRQGDIPGKEQGQVIAAGRTQAASLHINMPHTHSQFILK
jgi:hypothetical protein